MYSEDDAIKYIRQNVAAEIAEAYSDDEILNIIDMIFDYYEQNGMLEIDDDLDDDLSPEQLAAEITDYATRMLRRDREAKMQPEHLRPIIDAELAYEESLI